MNLLSSPFAPRKYAFSVGLLSRGTSAFARESMGETPHLVPHLLILLPSPWSRGEGLGVRGFALCFDWYFDREFNIYPRFRSVNKQLNLRLPSQGSTPHPPTPSPRSGARGRKRTEITQIHWDVTKLPPKSGPSKNSLPIREAPLGNVYYLSWASSGPSIMLYFIGFH